MIRTTKTKCNFNNFISKLLSYGVFNLIEFIFLFIAIPILNLSMTFKIVLFSITTFINFVILIILLIYMFKKINNTMKLANLVLFSWFSWVQAVISSVLGITLIIASRNPYEFQNINTIWIILFTSLVFYFISGLTTTIIFNVKIKNLKKIINNYNLLNNELDTNDLSNYILQENISYVPQYKYNITCSINFYNTAKTSISLSILLLVDPKIIFDIKLYKINSYFMNSDDPTISIKKPSNELIEKLNKSNLYLIKNESSITIVFNKNHVQYNELFEIIFNEINLNIETNDVYFSKFFSIVLKEKYNSSLNEIKCQIAIENQLEWQKQKFLNIKLSNLKTEEDDIK